MNINMNMNMNMNMNRDRHTAEHTADIPVISSVALCRKIAHTESSSAHPHPHWLLTHSTHTA